MLIIIFSILVFATTAANGRESSYACYWDKKRRTYLGDVYSVKWMEDSDKVSFIFSKIFYFCLILPLNSTNFRITHF